MTKKDPHTPLRKGWTTGACATAAAKAAYHALLGGEFADPVTVNLPRGRTPSFALNRHGQQDGRFFASVIKDAGDDPDVTHGAEIIVFLRSISPGSGIVFKNGEGVGLVTKPGLPIPVGEPAINPMPRQMISENLQEVADFYGVSCDVEVTVSIPGGQDLAQKTMNPRLGIMGGLSVLGTTGVVNPFSCAAWIHSIHRGIDVCRAMGITHLAACTGSTSEKTVCGFYPFEDSALIDMGDFAGAVLKYIRRCPVEKLTIGGGFAKLCKLAQGELDLHSARSRIDFDVLAGWVADIGGDAEFQAHTRQANTALEVLEMAQERGLDLGNLVAKRARSAAMAIANGACEIEIIAINRKGDVVGHAK